MAGQQGLTHVDFTVDDTDVNNGAKYLMKTVRPQWKQEDIKLWVFTAGITNKLVGCYIGTKKDEVILVRVYGQSTDLIIDRDAERQNMQILHRAGCAPPLYCTFNNGLCYGFVHGVCLDVDLVRDEVVVKLMAYEMARVHAIRPSLEDDSAVTKEMCAVHKTGMPASSENAPQPMIWQKTFKYLNLIPRSFEDAKRQERFQKEVPDFNALERELKMLQEHLQPLGSPVVFSHNDLLCNNIVYNKEKDQVTFIDYEYAGYNYEAYDLGNHFDEFAGVDEVDYALYPDREFQLKWLRTYLEYKNKLANKDASLVSARDVEVLYVQTNKFALLGHFFWGLWALIQAKYSTIDFDYLDYGIMRLNEYFAKKEQFLALKLPE